MLMKIVHLVKPLALMSVFLISNSIFAGPVTEIQGAQHFDDHIAKNNLVVVKFHSPMCGHCKSFAPEFQQAASIPGVSFIAVDITKPENKAILGRFPLSGVPTVYYLKGGSKVGSSTGSQKASELKQTVKNKFAL